MLLCELEPSEREREASQKRPGLSRGRRRRKKRKKKKRRKKKFEMREKKKKRAKTIFEYKLNS